MDSEPPLSASQDAYIMTKLHYSGVLTECRALHRIVHTRIKPKPIYGVNNIHEYISNNKIADDNSSICIDATLLA